MPALSRFRTDDGMYALKITCWHNATGVICHPDRSVMENWERYARWVPCRYVETCPRFPHLLDPEKSRQTATGGFVDLVPPTSRTVKAERERRRREKK